MKLEFRPLWLPASSRYLDGLQESAVKWSGEDVTDVCFFGNIFHLKVFKFCHLLRLIVISQ